MPKFGVNNLSKLKETILSKSFRNKYPQGTDRENPSQSSSVYDFVLGGYTGSGSYRFIIDDDTQMQLIDAEGNKYTFKKKDTTKQAN